MLQQNAFTEGSSFMSSFIKESLVSFWYWPSLQVSVIDVFSCFDRFTSLTLIFLVFFFVEKKCFCGTMFLLCGTLLWGLGRFFLPI